MTEKTNEKQTQYIRRAYAFLCKQARTGEAFTARDLSTASGWKESYCTINISKKLAAFVCKTHNGYVAKNMEGVTEDAFIATCSQVSEKSRDPFRPHLPPKVEGLVRKAREAALAAVQHYNNPTAMFKTGNFVVLMTIAYTALMHAVLEHDNVDYVAREKDGTPKKAGDGDMLWDMMRAVRYYLDSRPLEEGDAVRENLNVMYEVRNRIEHRYLPELDPALVGYCQSMLMNFEEIIVREFTNYYSLNSSLAVALQVAAARSPQAVAAMRSLQSREYDAIADFTRRYDEKVAETIYGNPKYCFRVWLLPKSANREQSADHTVNPPIEYLPVRDQKLIRDIERQIVAIKPVDPSKICNLWENEVVKKLVEELGPSPVSDGNEVKINGYLVRCILFSHPELQEHEFMYRPSKEGSRPMYSPGLVKWIIDEYRTEPMLFYRAKEKYLKSKKRKERSKGTNE